MDEKIIIEKEVNKYDVDAVGIFGSRAEEITINILIRYIYNRKFNIRTRIRA